LRFYSSLSLSFSHFYGTLSHCLSYSLLVSTRVQLLERESEFLSILARARALSLSPSPSLCLCVCVLCGVLVCCLHARVQVDLCLSVQGPCVYSTDLPTYLPTYLHTYLLTYLPYEGGLVSCTYLPTYLPIYLPTCLMKGALCPVPTYLVKWAFVTRT
jgi:hypothetical protein